MFKGRRLAIIAVFAVVAIAWLVQASRSNPPENLKAPEWVQRMKSVGFSTWPMAEKDMAVRTETYTTQAPLQATVKTAEQNLLPDGWKETPGDPETVFTLGNPAPRGMVNWLFLTRQAPWYRIRIRAGHAIVTPSTRFIPPREAQPWTTVTYEIGGRAPAIFSRADFDDQHLGHPSPSRVFVAYAPDR